MTTTVTQMIASKYAAHVARCEQHDANPLTLSRFVVEVMGLPSHYAA